MKRLLIIVYILSCYLGVSQNRQKLVISGKVYISSSRSQGVMNGKTITEPQQVFKLQTICFSKDTVKVNTQTDSTGHYSVELEPGTYNVYQEQALKDKRKGTINYGSYGLHIEKGGDGHDVYFKNTVNGRSVNQQNNMMPSKGNTNAIKSKN